MCDKSQPSGSLGSGMGWVPRLAALASPGPLRQLLKAVFVCLFVCFLATVIIEEADLDPALWMFYPFNNVHPSFLSFVGPEP